MYSFGFPFLADQLGNEHSQAFGFLTGRNHEPAADVSLAAGTDALGNRDNVCGISVTRLLQGIFASKISKPRRAEDCESSQEKK